MYVCACVRGHIRGRFTQRLHRTGRLAIVVPATIPAAPAAHSLSRSGGAHGADRRTAAKACAGVPRRHWREQFYISMTVLGCTVSCRGRRRVAARVAGYRPLAEVASTVCD
mgnify:CR=1 FL=1